MKMKILNDMDENFRLDSMETLQALSESTDDYLYLWEIEVNRVWFFGGLNSRFDLLKEGNAHCSIEDLEAIAHPRDLPELKADLNLIMQGKKTVHDMEYRLMDRDGNFIWISCRGTVTKASEDHPAFMIGRISDMALRHKVDALTGMFNMVKMHEDIERILSVTINGFLLILGIDNFRKINIKHGHETGNQMLKLLGDALEQEFTAQRAYRLERDCFALCLPNVTRSEVQGLYNKIQKIVASQFTVSGGAASFASVSGRKSETLYQYAEYALDKAKGAGKNRLVFFAVEDYQKDVSSITLLEELKNSVKQDCSGFSLVYQPQIKAGSYQLFGAEALLRYDSPVRGRVMPTEFIPLLEENRLIDTVGLWVLKTALNQCREWRKKLPEFHISVNVSYMQLNQKDIKDNVLEALEQSGLPGEALTLEVTESMQLQNFQYYNGIFSEWKNAGIGISVDDFGTGYSSLGYLKYLKVDEIKIDRCFVSGIQNSSYNYRLLFNMLEFAADARIRVCCEGVEDKEELQVLEELKPNLLQGYLFSKPCEAELFERRHVESENPEYQEYRKYIGQVQKKYFGKLLNMHRRDILNATNLGLWIICINEKTGSSQLYADETMSRIMGADRNLSPEECYQFWYDRIRPDCYDYVNRSVERMISSGSVVQIQYLWNHPELGEVEVRCTGIHAEDLDGMICLEGYHRMVSNIERTWFHGKEER